MMMTMMLMMMTMMTMLMIMMMMTMTMMMVVVVRMTTMTMMLMMLTMMMKMTMMMVMQNNTLGSRICFSAREARLRKLAVSAKQPALPRQQRRVYISSCRLRSTAGKFMQALRRSGLRRATLKTRRPPGPAIQA